jgi:hypothetical protein
LPDRLPYPAPASHRAHRPATRRAVSVSYCFFGAHRCSVVASMLPLRGDEFLMSPGISVNRRRGPGRRTESGGRWGRQECSEHR